MGNSPAKAGGKTRIQHKNERLILEAALQEFATYGFRGATVEQIARRAGLSKPNLLYYFRSKDQVYEAVLEHIVEDWLEPLQAMKPEGEPRAELEKYILAKLEMIFEKPEASRLFANEILAGAPQLLPYLKGPLRKQVEATSKIILAWIAAGKLPRIDPVHFIFSMWSVTQHYADFAVQVEAVMGRKPKPAEIRRAVLDNLLRGL